MKKALLGRLTYANVVSTLCLFLLLGGGAAVAATQLPKNSVGSKQLKKNAVAAAKIKNGAVTGAKLAGGAVSADKIAPGAVGTGGLVDKAVTGGKLADGAVGTGKLAEGAVGTGKLAPAAVNTGKLADGSVTTSKLADNAVGTGKLDAEAVTTGKIANDAVTGAKVDEGSLHFTCNNPASAVLVVGGPCLFKTTRAGGATWTEAIQACQAGVPGATLPTVAQVEAYARLGGVPWKEVLAFTSDLAGSGPGAPSGAWSVQTDANGIVTVILATPLTNKVQTDVLCEYDPATSPTPGS
jgi:hypothetical protein